MQWYSVLAILYVVGGLAADVVTWKLIDYCRPRSIFEKDDSTNRHLMETLEIAGSRENQTFFKRVRDAFLWPLLVPAVAIMALTVRRRRTAMNRALNGEFRRLDKVKTDGFDTMRDAHENTDLAGAGLTALSVAVTVDGYTGFVHWLSKEKLGELWGDKGAIGDFLKEVADGAKATVPTQPVPTQPKLELVREPAMQAALEKAINISGLCFYGKPDAALRATPVVICFPVTGGNYMYLPLFKSDGDGKEQLGAIGLDVDKVGLVPCAVGDAARFLTSIQPLAVHAKTGKLVRVRVITNVRKALPPGAVDSQWCWDTICELAPGDGPTSRDEGPKNHPPAA